MLIQISDVTNQRQLPNNHQIQAGGAGLRGAVGFGVNQVKILHELGVAAAILEVTLLTE